MSRLLCRLFGHRGFWQHVLREGPTIRYGVEHRDEQGRAWSWPECRRCGWQVVTVEWVE